ncbi:Ig-like domain-containing protein, partial [bacterium]|nr:Ig-like domain-containing protein [bacterium]
MDYRKFILPFVFVAAVMILAVFWGCQEGTGPTPPFFNVWSIDSIYAATTDDPDIVVAGQTNTICAYITGKDEKGNTILLPTTELVYFTIVADTISASMTTGKDTLWRPEMGGVYPYQEGYACMQIALPSNTVALSVVVTVVGYDEYSRGRTFTVVSGTEQNILSMQLSANQATVGGEPIDVVVWVQDQFGQPVSGELVCFSSTNHEIGVFADSCLFSDNAGRCATQFIIGTRAGVDTICASDRTGNSICTEIIVNPELASTESLYADFYHIYRCGSGLQDQTTITAKIYDRFWNPVRNGTPVIFEIDTFTFM